MNCVKGDIARYVGNDKDIYGYLVKCIGRRDGATLAGWIVEPPLPVPRGGWVADKVLKPIRDNPGDEDFVIKARKSLPRAKPVTGPVTINERGEPAPTNEQVRRALGRRAQA